MLNNNILIKFIQLFNWILLLPLLLVYKTKFWICPFPWGFSLVLFLQLYGNFMFKVVQILRNYFYNRWQHFPTILNKHLLILRFLCAYVYIIKKKKLHYFHLKNNFQIVNDSLSYYSYPMKFLSVTTWLYPSVVVVVMIGVPIFPGEVAYCIFSTSWTKLCCMLKCYKFTPRCLQTLVVNGNFEEFVYLILQDMVA